MPIESQELIRLVSRYFFANSEAAAHNRASLLSSQVPDDIVILTNDPLESQILQEVKQVAFEQTRTTEPDPVPLENLWIYVSGLTASFPLVVPPFINDRAIIYCVSGDELLRQGKYEAAIASYTRAISLDPQAVYYNNRGTAYHELGNTENTVANYNAAIADYNEAIRKDQGNALYWNELGYTYWKLGRYHAKGEYANSATDARSAYINALAPYKVAIELEPNNAMYRNRLGDVYYGLKDYNSARQSYSMAINLDNTNAIYYNNRAFVNYRVGRTRNAREDFATAIDSANWPEQKELIDDCRKMLAEIPNRGG